MTNTSRERRTHDVGLPEELKAALLRGLKVSWVFTAKVGGRDVIVGWATAQQLVKKRQQLSVLLNEVKQERL